MIDSYSGPIINVALISFMILFNIIYLRKTFDLVFLFVNVHISSLIFFMFFQSSLLHPISYKLFFLILIYTLGFVFGYYLHYAKNKSIKKIEKTKVSLKKLYFLNTAGLVTFCLAFTYELQQASWVLPILADDKLLAYLNFPTHFVHYLVVSGIPISGVFVYIAEHYKYKRLTIYFFVFIIFVLLLVQLARAVLMAQLVTIIMIYYKENKIKLSWAKITLFISALMLLITILGYFRTGDTLQVLLDIGGMESWPLWSVPFAWVYLYFSTTLENFRDIVTYYNEFTYGVQTILKPFANLLQLKDAEFFIVNLKEVSAGGFNTAGYYMPVYVDYGYLGWIYTFALGYISRKILVSKNLAVYLFSTFWTYCIFTSSINSYFNAFFTYIYFTYYFLIVKVASNRLTSKNIE